MKKIVHFLLVCLVGSTFAVHTGESFASHAKVDCHHGVCHHYKNKHYKKHKHYHKHKIHLKSKKHKH